MSNNVEEQIICNIKRSDLIYKEIEGFKYYDLYIAMIYEMYLRSNHYKEDNRYYQFQFLNYEEKKSCYLQKYSTDDIILYKTNNETLTLTDIIYTIFPELYNEKLKEHDQNLIFQSVSVDYLIENYINNDHAKFVEVVFKDKQNNKFIKVTKEILKSYLTKDIRVINSTIIPKFSRPQLYSLKSNFVTIHGLNLALPDNVIIDYLKHLRKDIRPSRQNLENIFYKQNKELKKINNSSSTSTIKDKNILKNSQKVADLLFTYDVMKSKKDKEDGTYYQYIIDSIADSRDYNLISISTLKNYYKLAKELIDENKFEFFIM